MARQSGWPVGSCRIQSRYSFVIKAFNDVNLPRGNVNLRRMKYSVLQAPDDGTEMQRKPQLLHRGFKSLMLEV